MKIRFVIILAVVVIAANITLGIVFLKPATYTKLNILTVNDLTHTCSGLIIGNDVTMPEYEHNYAVMDDTSTLFYTSSDDYSPTIQEAIINRDTIIDLTSDGRYIGKLIIANDYDSYTGILVNRIVILLALTTIVMLVILVGYMLYLHRVIFHPFKALKNFAVRVAGGNLDFPLAMNKSNTFGAFTESFDLMRDELKRAREQERLANQSKKELIAQLSHDIKTPIASIKAVAEVMSVSTAGSKALTQLAVIQSKADQVDGLISNLFNATLEELQRLEVTVTERSSQELYDLIKQADFMKRAAIGTIPQCLLQFDPLRLQQVLDNLLSNSYKYADTNIDVTASFSESNPHAFTIAIQDYGHGIPSDELSLIFEKFYRCSNVDGQNGSGLGLYISRYLMEQMGGSIVCQNNNKGFCILLNLRIS